MVCIIDIFRNQKIYNEVIITEATIVNDDGHYNDAIATIVPIEIYPLPVSNYNICKRIKNIYENELLCFIFNGILLCLSLCAIYNIIKFQQYYYLYFIFFNTFVLCSYCCYRIT